MGSSERDAYRDNNNHGEGYRQSVGIEMCVAGYSASKFLLSKLGSNEVNYLMSTASHILPFSDD